MENETIQGVSESRPRFPLRLLLIVFIVLGVVITGAVWFCSPSAINVLVTYEPCSLHRYDDGAGHLPLGASVRILNLSGRAVWYLGSTRAEYELVDGKWKYFQTSCKAQSEPGRWGGGSYHWESLYSGQSAKIATGAVSENAKETKVAIPFTTDWFPTTAHWVVSPAVRIVKKGAYFFPKVIKDAKQEEEVLPLPEVERGHVQY